MPTYFEAGRPDMLCFPIPKIVDTYTVWHAIVTVGDTNEMSVTTYPKGVVSWGDYEFPEKGFALNPLRMNRVPDVNPLVEYVHETGIVSQMAPAACCWTVCVRLGAATVHCFSTVFPAGRIS